MQEAKRILQTAAEAHLITKFKKMKILHIYGYIFKIIPVQHFSWIMIHGKEYVCASLNRSLKVSKLVNVIKHRIKADWLGPKWKMENTSGVQSSFHHILNKKKILKKKLR